MTGWSSHEDRRHARGFFLFNPASVLQTRLGIILAVYISSSVLIYGVFERWVPSDCVYFAITTMTTVGFGDLSPRHAVSRMFASLWVLVALVFVAEGISRALGSFVTRELDAANRLLQLRLGGKLAGDEVGASAISPGPRQAKRRLAKQVLGLCGFIAASSVVARAALRLGAVDALYFSVVTLTTLGLGDVVPRTPGEKWIVSVLCLVGVPLFGSALASLVSLAGSRHHIHRIHGGLTARKLIRMRQFAEAMYKRGLYPKAQEVSDAMAGERKITPFEFCCFLLLQNRVISMEDMDAMLRNFRELDLVGDGYLWSKDLHAWEEKRQREVDGP